MTNKMLKEAFCDNFGLEYCDISEDTLLIEDLGLDSLSIVTFIADINKRYNIEFDQDLGALSGTYKSFSDSFQLDEHE